MEKINKLPLNFFTKFRKNKTTNNIDDNDKIYPIKWSKEVMKGKKEVVVSLSKKK